MLLFWGWLRGFHPMLCGHCGGRPDHKIIVKNSITGQLHGLGKYLGCVPLLLLFHVTETAISITHPELFRSSGETVVVNLIYIPPSNPAWTLSTNSRQLFRSFPWWVVRCCEHHKLLFLAFCDIWGWLAASSHNCVINNLFNYIKKIDFWSLILKFWDVGQNVLEFPDFIEGNK